MKKSFHFIELVALAIIGCVPLSAFPAGQYPTKPVRIVVPFTPGGSNDLVARVIAQKLTEAWGAPAIVDNRPGAGSTIGIELVTKAAPDGHTLLATSGGVAINVSLYKLPFNPVTDLAPVALIAQMPYLLAVNPSQPIKSTKELINLARAQPGKIAFASSGAGTSSHLTMEMFNSIAKLKMLHIPYKGGGPAVNAAMGGEVQVLFNVITGVLPYAKSGKLRAIGVSSARRSDAAPDVPTIAESALPGFEVIAWYNLFAPAKTPTRIIDALNKEVNSMLGKPEIKERFDLLGVSPLTGTPTDLGNYLKLEISRWARLIKEADIKIQ